MKIRQFNQDGSLEVREVFVKHFGREGSFEDVKMHMKVFTDGEIESVDESISKNIDNISILRRYNDGSSTFRTSTIHLKNHTYAVVYVIAKEFLRYANGGGWYDIVKDVTVYTTNKRDLQALRKANKTMKMVAMNQSSINYGTMLYRMLHGEDEQSKVLEYEKADKYVFTLKK